MLYSVVSHFLARPVERKRYSVEPEDSLRPLLKAIWVRNSVNSYPWPFRLLAVHEDDFVISPPTVAVASGSVIEGEGGDAHEDSVFLDPAPR